MKKLILAGAAVVLTASGAYAADVVGPASYDWTGPYIGLNAGYGDADVDYKFHDEGHYNNDPGDEFSQSLDGLVGGLQAGYSWQMDSFVLGLEGGFTWLDLEKRSTSPFYPDTDEFITKIDWVASITPRIGVALDNILFYAKGGVAFADINARIEDTADFVETEKTQTGWTVGGGVDFGLSERWTVGIEGNYYDFGSFDAGEETRDLDTGDPDGSFTDHDVETTMWSILARVNLRF